MDLRVGLRSGNQTPQFSVEVSGVEKKRQSKSKSKAFVFTLSGENEIIYSEFWVLDGHLAGLQRDTPMVALFYGLHSQRIQLIRGRQRATPAVRSSYLILR